MGMLNRAESAPSEPGTEHILKARSSKNEVMQSHELTSHWQIGCPDASPNLSKDTRYPGGEER